MKIRNKKTGEIIDSKRQVMALIVVRTDDREVDGYSSLAELNTDWEDYKPAEPLIKDEKIRKAVRAWAEVCDVERCYYDGFGEFAIRQCGVKFRGRGLVIDIRSGNYDIAELCGEEE